MIKPAQSRIPPMIFGLILFLMSHLLAYAQKSTDTYQPTSMPTGFPTWQPASNQPLIDPVIMQNQQQGPDTSLPNDGSVRDPNMIPEPNWRKNPIPYQTEPPLSYPGPNYNNNECRNNPYEGSQRSDYLYNNGCGPNNGYYSNGMKNCACYDDGAEWSNRPSNNDGYSSNNNFCNRRDRGCGVYDSRGCNSRYPSNHGAFQDNNRDCQFQGGCNQATWCQNPGNSIPNKSCKPVSQYC